jgi:hypothetical protein
MVTLCYINEGDKDKPLVTIFTQQDVEPWGELSFSYSGVTDEDIAVSIIFVRALKLRYLTFCHLNRLPIELMKAQFTRSVSAEHQGVGVSCSSKFC